MIAELQTMVNDSPLSVLSEIALESMWEAFSLSMYAAYLDYDPIYRDRFIQWATTNDG